MRRIIPVLLLPLLLMGGCATSSVQEEEMTALKSRIAELERELRSVGAAQSAASAAQREAAGALSLAERAMQAAEAANEKISRMSETCCSPRK